MNCIKKGVGSALKDLRKMSNLTQEKLAEKIGVNLRQLARIEAGESFITAETLYNICKTFNVNPSALFEFELREELLKTGTGNKVYFSAIKSGNIIKLINETAEDIKERKNSNHPSDIDIKMQITAKKINKEVVVDEIVDGKISITKIYFPNGEIKIEEKNTVSKQLEELKQSIDKISDDSRKINFLNTALKALSSRKALCELKSLLNGMELMYDDIE